MDATKWLAIVGVVSALTLGVGFVTGLISVGLGWKVNRAQKVEMARANESAADAKLKAERLEGDNLALRSQVATLETQASDAKKDVAGLQKAASDAQTALAEQRGKTAQLEKAAADAKRELSEQQERTADLERVAAVQQIRAAEAEKALEELKRRAEPREFWFGREEQDILRNGAKGEIAEIIFLEGNGESATLAGHIASMFEWAQWKIKRPTAFATVGTEADAGYVNAILHKYAFADKDVVVISKSNLDFLTLKKDSPLWFLLRAMEVTHLRVGTTADGLSPANTFRIVIVPR